MRAMPKLNLLPLALVALVITVVLGLPAIYTFRIVDSFRQESSFTSENINEAEAQGRMIVAAINEYHDSTGSYPESLKVLVEQSLLDEVPTPPLGNHRWEYKLLYPDVGGIFKLQACTDDHYPCVYYSFEEEKWRIDM